MKSEFGRGYATCLRQFVNHSARLDETLALYRKMAKKEPTLFSDSDAVEIWANGASDHLYDLIRPKRGIRRREWEQAKAVQARALDMGHGFRRHDWTLSDALLVLAQAGDLLDDLTLIGYAVGTLDEALATDHTLGLLPEAGSWSCAKDLRRSDRVAVS